MGKLIKSNGEYTPTPAEARLLKVMSNSENYGKTVTDICKLADISRVTYYELLKKQEFIEYKKTISINMLHESLFPIMSALAREAKKGSHNHIKLALEMVGVYTPKGKIDISVNQGIEEHIKQLQEYNQYMKEMGEVVEDVEYEVSD